MIKFNEENFIHGTEEVMNNLRNDGYGDQIELDTTGECIEGPCAYVNEVLVEADTPEELYNNIKKQL